jgi:hypothetical protein
MAIVRLASLPDDPVRHMAVDPEHAAARQTLGGVLSHEFRGCSEA